VSATQKFYIGFFVVLALVIAASYVAGYHAGVAHAGAEVHARRIAL
jgi:uncharacterized protein YqgC (DUF456 family)